MTKVIRLNENKEKKLEERRAKIVTCCPDSPNNECKEDLAGYCYYCYRNMLE